VSKIDSTTPPTVVVLEKKHFQVKPSWISGTRRNDNETDSEGCKETRRKTGE
jgi:hypothetical protein